MRTVYVEPVSYECHLTQNDEGTRIPYDTNFFDGKCDVFVEGYRVVPNGHSWTRHDGAVFSGEMIVPFKPYSELDEAQIQYEFERIAEYSVVLSEIESMILPVEVQGIMSTFVESRKQAILSRINDMLTALYTLEVTPVDE